MSYNKPNPPDVTIRYAIADDAPALARLAALDSQDVPEGALLVAQVDGELWAALAVTGTGAIADPFRRSADTLALLEARAAQLRRGHEAAFRPVAWLRAAVVR
jgi:hypothetical protein